MILAVLTLGISCEKEIIDDEIVDSVFTLASGNGFANGAFPMAGTGHQ